MGKIAIVVMTVGTSGWKAPAIAWTQQRPYEWEWGTHPMWWMREA